MVVVHLRMPTYSRGAAARLLLLLCGVAAVRISAVCRSLRRFFPNNHGSWLALSLVLLLAGGVSLIAAVTPRRWIVRMRGPDPKSDFSDKLTIRLLLGFAAFSYLLVAGPTFAGPSLEIPPGVLYAACPACALTITVDPSLASVLLVLAPVNAAVYGAIGATIGVVLAATKRTKILKV
jgi:hypothetical protein